MLLNRCKLTMVVIIAVMLAFQCMAAGQVLAFDPPAAPPQLDQQQASKWVNTLPWSRPYLARLWDVPPAEAEKYGAVYKMPICGISGISSDKTSGFSSSGFNTIDTRWDRVIPVIEQFKPIPYKIPQYDISGVPPQNPYEYPPSLDAAQGIRWGMALPTARAYLAKIWDIPKELAERYGAIY